MEGEARDTRLRRRLLIAATALLLTGTFMYLRFPYERLIPNVESAFEQATGSTLRISDISAWPSLMGLGIVAGPLRVDFPEGAHLIVERVRLRPAWDFAWLGTAAIFALEVEGGPLRGEGLLGLSGAPFISGALRQIDLSQIPPHLLGEGIALEGFTDVDFDVRLPESGAEGELNIAAEQGSLRLPVVPIPFDFETIELDIELGGSAWLTVHSLAVQSPLLEGDLTGTVGPPPLSELDLRGNFQTAMEARAPLKSLGFKLSRSGVLQLVIQGNAAAPKFH